MLYNIEDAREICGGTPYELECRRQEAHLALFDNVKQYLTPKEGFSKDDMFLRSKEIFAHLDLVFNIYNDWNLDLKNYLDRKFLIDALYKFLQTTETKYYLEGKTAGIHGVI